MLTCPYFLPPADPQILGIERDLSETLQVIRAIRNTHIPVNKLPPEVLSRILQHRDSGQDLVAATHVCRYWRSTLISSPSLWIPRPRRAPQSRSTYPKNKIVRHRGLRSRLHTSYGLLPSLAQFCSILGTPGNAFSRRFCRCLQQFSRPTSTVALLCYFLRHFPGTPIPFQLPNLTKPDLRLISSLLRLYSNRPRLQKVRIRVYCQILQDVNRVIPLDLLVELEYTCHTVTRILPFLKLPHFKRLQVSLQARNVDEVSVFSPHDGQQLPCRTFTL